MRKGRVVAWWTDAKPYSWPCPSIPTCGWAKRLGEMLESLMADNACAESFWRSKGHPKIYRNKGHPHETGHMISLTA